MFPSAARAEWSDEGSVGGGVFAGVTFGSRVAFDWGLEGFGTVFFVDQGMCGQEPRAGMGPLLQLSLLGLSRPRLTAAVHGGGELHRPLVALDGEVGVSVRWLDGVPFYALHVGALSDHVLGNLAVRHQFGLGETFVGAGLRILPTMGVPGTCSIGRSYRTGDGAVVLASTEVGQAVADAEPCPELAAAWERDAVHECASVPAFLQLASELLAAGAPDALVSRALDAAEDELHHARLCSILASRARGRSVHVHMPAVPLRPALSGRAAHERLAIESWFDGCLGEGISAARAASAASKARDRGARSAQRRIARDEANHAGLAWDVLRWSLAAGGRPVRDALGDLRGQSPDLHDPLAEDGLSDRGRLGRRDSLIIGERHAAASRRALDGLLTAPRS